MEKIKEGLSFTEFIERFHKDFKSYSKHKIESWILTTRKNTSTTPKSQNPSTLFCISDFAQNIKLSTKLETSGEYFHKRQIALYGTVSTVNAKVSEDNTVQHTLSQLTTSDCK